MAPWLFSPILRTPWDHGALSRLPSHVRLIAVVSAMGPQKTSTSWGQQLSSMLHRFFCLLHDKQITKTHKTQQFYVLLLHVASGFTWYFLVEGLNKPLKDISPGTVSLKVSMTLRPNWLKSGWSLATVCHCMLFPRGQGDLGCPIPMASQHFDLTMTTMTTTVTLATCWATCCNSCIATFFLDLFGLCTRLQISSILKLWGVSPEALCQ